MKRYDLDGYGGFMTEAKNGDYMEFTDHQAEIAKRDDMLRECLNFINKNEPRLTRNGILGALHNHLNPIAQKDSTQ